MPKEIRVRIAPSPTGYLHIGTARTALFNWLFARHNNAKFVMRIEDTDLERSEKRFEDDILEGLKWLGLDWDEFYKQSDRIPIYSKYIKKLLDEGKAFWCYHTEAELEEEKKEQTDNKKLQRHVCSYKKEKVEKRDQPGIIRLAVDEDSTEKIQFEDIIRGHVEFEARLLGDFSIAKDIEVPLYNFAVVVDDYEMDISHVIRGEDHISNTPKQILLQNALGFERPEYAHLPLILGEDRSKLSKRHGATSLIEYESQGYLPEAIFNFLALLGWTTPGDKEILSVNELVELFELNRVHKSGAVFDIKKLDWINSEHFKILSPQEQIKRLLNYLAKQTTVQNIDTDYFFKILPLVSERVKKLSDIAEFDFFFKEPEYDRGLLVWKNKDFEEIKSSLLEVAKIIEKKGTEDKDALRQELDSLGVKLGDRGLAYWPFRVALSGRKASPDPVDIAEILGKQKTLERVKRAVELL